MNADGIAPFYRWIEYAAFGTTLERARVEFLSWASKAERVLILGEGDGRFLRALLQCNGRARVDIVERSARMIGLARKRVPETAHSRVQFHLLDLTRDPLPAGPFDLVVTLFVLDVLNFSDTTAFIENVVRNMAPGALWLITEFQEPSGWIARMHARLWLFVMYRFFALTTGLSVSSLPPYRTVLQTKGWVEVAHRERRFGLIRSQVWRRATLVRPDKAS